MLSEQQITKASFDLFRIEGSEDNQADLDRLKRMLPVALAECCTEKQRLYITHFFADRMMVKQIAALYGVNSSTVSRCIKRGLRTMHDHLRFCSLELCKVPQKQGSITQKAGRKPMHGHRESGST